MPKNRVALGTIVSSAPRAALMAVLGQLRPQFEASLEEETDSADARKRYRIFIESSAQHPGQSQVSDWLSLKSALMARFPADKPDAVTAIDP